jgi:hypothetical protein
MRRTSDLWWHVARAILIGTVGLAVGLLYLVGLVWLALQVGYS